MAHQCHKSSNVPTDVSYLSLFEPLNIFNDKLNITKHFNNLMTTQMLMAY